MYVKNTKAVVVMSYEMKDILKTMIDNNEAHWSADTMDMVRVEIHNVYAQAAKADEYEAKAKAYNLLKSNLEKEVEILIDKVSGFPYVDAPIESTIGHFEYVLEMMKKYESGESQ